MLYRILNRMIRRGQVEGMAEKLDVFLAADRITVEQYTELKTLMQAE